MRIFIPLIVTLISMTPSYSQIKHDKAFTVDSLIERHIAAIGGRARLDTIRNRTVVARIESMAKLENLRIFSSNDSIFPQMNGIYMGIFQPPNKSYEEMQLFNPPELRVFMGDPEPYHSWNDGNSVTTTNSLFGEFGGEMEKKEFQQKYNNLQLDSSQMSPSRIDSIFESAKSPIRQLSGNALDTFLEERNFAEVLRFDELGYKVELQSQEFFDGRCAYKLIVRKQYSTEAWMIDCITYANIGILRYKTADLQEPSCIIRFDDYKHVDGILLPHRITKFYNGNFSTTYNIQQYIHNTEIAEDIFVYPNGLDKH